MSSYVSVCLEAGDAGSVVQIGALSILTKDHIAQTRKYPGDRFLRKTVKVAKLRRYRARSLALADEV